MTDDIWCISFEEHLQETILVNAKIKELDLSSDKYYIGHGTDNSQGMSHPFENSPLTDVFLYDGIGDQNILLVQGASRRKRRKERKYV